MATIEVTAGAVTKCPGEEEGSGPYYDVEVIVDGTTDLVSVERDGSPLGGAIQLRDWVGPALASLLGAMDKHDPNEKRAALAQIRVAAQAAIASR